jgi:hypothetical protein
MQSGTGESRYSAGTRDQFAAERKCNKVQVHEGVISLSERHISRSWEMKVIRASVLALKESGGQMLTRNPPSGHV